MKNLQTHEVVILQYSVFGVTHFCNTREKGKKNIVGWRITRMWNQSVPFWSIPSHFSMDVVLIVFFYYWLWKHIMTVKVWRNQRSREQMLRALRMRWWNLLVREGRCRTRVVPGTIVEKCVWKLDDGLRIVYDFWQFVRVLCVLVLHINAIVYLMLWIRF